MPELERQILRPPPGADATPPPLGLQVALDAPSYSLGCFLDAVGARGYRNVRRQEATTGETDPLSPPELGGRLLHCNRESGASNLIVEGLRDTLAYITLRRFSAQVTVAAHSAEGADAHLAELIAELPEPESPEVRTPISFWSERQGSGHSIQQRIEPRRWAEVAAGYARSTVAGLEPLMKLREGPSAGRLILWHGAPGTGKTHALRALANEWRDWCSLEFITDPDRFLGQGMAYMFEVLAGNTRPTPRGHAFIPDGFGGDPDGAPADHKLIVLEDAGELLAADARRQAGQGLSRLLNLTDGLLGLGMNAIVLITTNEPLGRLHPAIHRPGRCLAEVEFEALDPLAANRWLAEQGSQATVEDPKTLAQLYALRDGRAADSERMPVGFG